MVKVAAGIELVGRVVPVGPQKFTSIMAVVIWTDGQVVRETVVIFDTSNATINCLVYQKQTNLERDNGDKYFCLKIFVCIFHYFKFVVIKVFQGKFYKIR